MNRIKFLLLTIAASTLLFSCKKDDEASLEPPRDRTTQYATEINDIEDPDIIFGLAVKAFFLPEKTLVTSWGFIGHISLNEKYWLQFFFYMEVKNKVHFIKTIYMREK